MMTSWKKNFVQDQAKTGPSTTSSKARMLRRQFCADTSKQADTLPKIAVCLASFKPINRKRELAMNLARDHNLHIESTVDFKKKNQLLLSVIAGPHVHKKSRDQYKMQIYRGLFVLVVNTREEYKRFLTYKKQLYRLQVDEGMQLSFAYLRDEVCCLSSRFCSA
uniref:Ribosomal protein S10 n=1 Tax=Marophrys sp. SRT127 TaxID=2488311 RepID=A0A455RGC9_9EUKA|nr:ribosomal protein S10 [Marophrys sp. SRT127]